MKKRILLKSLLPFLIVGIIVFIVYAGFSVQAEEKPGKNLLSPPDVKNWSAFFPLKVGNRWVYEKEMNSAGDPDVTVIVSGMGKVEGVECSIYETYIGREFNRREYLEVRPQQGIFSRKRELIIDGEMKEFYPQPPDMILKFPLKLGDSWEWKDNSLHKLKGFNTFKITGFEKVKTPAGEFDCFKIEVSQESFRGARFRTIRWFAEGVGMVKEFTRENFNNHPKNENTGITFVLKNYSVTD